MLELDKYGEYAKQPYNNSRISRFIAQYGKCAITGIELGKSDWHFHHKKPYHLSKDDRYANLIVLHESVHRIIHLKDAGKIGTLVDALQLNNKQMDKSINYGNSAIIIQSNWK